VVPEEGDASMPTMKRITCECGFVARGATDDELVEVIQKHAKQVHDIDLRREQALAMAEIEPYPVRP